MVQLVIDSGSLVIYLCQTVNVISFCLVLLLLYLFTKRRTFTEDIYYNYVKRFRERKIK